MKYFLLLLTFLFSTLSYGQFAVITDKDGFTNVRKDSVKGDNVFDKLSNGHLIYCLEKKGNWVNIDYIKNNKERNGYIYKDRYKLVSKYLSIPKLAEENNLVKFGKDSIEVIVTQKRFYKSRHQFKYFKETKGQIELIDNKNYWGTDGGMPQTEYKTITLKIGQRIVQLPRAALENLYEPSLYNIEVYFNKEKNIIYIQSINSDGAGSYEIIWKIENGKYKERFVAYGF
jgi:aryl carrier-like protein